VAAVVLPIASPGLSSPDDLIAGEPYDDGFSTGRLRQFIPGMWGRRTSQKMSTLSGSGQRYHAALKTLLDYRLPEGTTAPCAAEPGAACVWRSARLRWSHAPRGLRRSRGPAGDGDLPVTARSSWPTSRAARCRPGVSTSRLLHREHPLCGLLPGLLPGLQPDREGIRRLLGVARHGAQRDGRPQLRPHRADKDGGYLRNEVAIVSPQRDTSVEEIFPPGPYLSAEEAAKVDAMARADKGPSARAHWHAPAEPRRHRRPGRCRSDHLRAGDPELLTPAVVPHRGRGRAIVQNTGAEKVFVSNIRTITTFRGAM